MRPTVLAPLLTLLLPLHPLPTLALSSPGNAVVLNACPWPATLHAPERTHVLGPSAGFYWEPYSANTTTAYPPASTSSRGGAENGRALKLSNGTAASSSSSAPAGGSLPPHVVFALTLDVAGGRIWYDASVVGGPAPFRGSRLVVGVAEEGEDAGDGDSGCGWIAWPDGVPVQGQAEAEDEVRVCAADRSVVMILCAADGAGE